MYLADGLPTETKEENDFMKPETPKKAKINAEPRNVEEQVRARAYELFEARGREEGHALDDWLRAEQETIGRRARTVAA